MLDIRDCFSFNIRAVVGSEVGALVVGGEIAVGLAVAPPSPLGCVLFFEFFFGPLFDR